MQSSLSILPSFSPLDLVEFFKRIQRSLSLTHTQTHKHFQKCFHFFSFHLVNFVKEARQESILRRNPELRELFQLLSGQTSLNPVCGFSVLFSLITTRYVKPLWLFWLLSLFSPEGYGPVLCAVLGWKLCWPLLDRNLSDLEERHGGSETRRELLIVRKTSCCCFYLGQMKNGQVSKTCDWFCPALRSIGPEFSELVYGTFMAT